MLQARGRRAYPAHCRLTSSRARWRRARSAGGGVILLVARQRRRAGVAISNAGGLACWCSRPTRRASTGCPGAAIATGVRSTRWHPGAAGRAGLSPLQRARGGRRGAAGEGRRPAGGDVLEVFRATAIDFRQYRSATITRRAVAGMALRGVARVDYLPSCRRLEEARAPGRTSSSTSRASSATPRCGARSSAWWCFRGARPGRGRASAAGSRPRRARRPTRSRCCSPRHRGAAGPRRAR